MKTAISAACSEPAAAIKAEKHALREEILGQRRAMGETARAAAAAVICDRLLNLPEYRRAKRVAAFYPMAEEVDIRPVLEDCLRHKEYLALPRVADRQKRRLCFHQIQRLEDLVPGFGGIREPSDGEAIPPQTFDFIVVPAVAIDAEKKRIGYGGGFYDTLLLSVTGTFACSPVFRCQRVKSLPCEGHDQSINFIITE